MRDSSKFFKVFPASFMAVLMIAGAAFSQAFLREAYNDPFNTANCDVDGWEVLFDGTDETAIDNLWISNASHGDGGNWWIDTDPDTEALGTIAPGQRVLWSNQNPGGSGGLMYSHRTMENTEVVMGFFPGWRNDGGLFLRSNGRGGAYQIMMDYQPGKTCGGIWPEGISAPSQHNYTLEEEFRVRAEGIDWDVNDWPDIWDPDGYNKVYGKIVGETYVFGYIHDEAHWITDYTQGSNAPELNATGYVGFQIHAGEGSWQGGPNRYSYIKIREIDDNNNPVCIGTRTSSCNIPGYTEYNPNFDIGDPGKCVTLGEPVKTASAKMAVSAQLAAQSRNGQLIVSGQLAQNYELQLVSASGKTISSLSGEAGSVSHSFAAPEGVYFLHIISGGKTSIQRVVSL